VDKEIGKKNAESKLTASGRKVFSQEQTQDDTFIGRADGLEISVLIEHVGKNQLFLKPKTKETVRLSATPRASAKPTLAMGKRTSLHKAKPTELKTVQDGAVATREAHDQQVKKGNLRKS
jgi:hypothetical protein